MNLYVHFPFCRSKCSYCSLYSRVGVSAADRDGYVRNLARTLSECADAARLDTVYFGGGTPALCNLAPLFRTLEERMSPGCEFTVELHPLDVTDDTLAALEAGGVNRISMGVQSLDDAILADMGRGYTFSEAERAFAKVKTRFDNAGIDLIVGYPGETAALLPRHARLAKWGLRHCSVYSLQNERNLANAIDDDTTLDRLHVTAQFLADIGLERYEISNYAVPGFECRHNLAVWRGEDYIGLGDGACGRVGLQRTRSFGGRHPTTETLAPERDEIERRIFRLRTKEGIDPSGHPEWIDSLDRFATEGLLVRREGAYALTERGSEVCDSILAELI